MYAPSLVHEIYDLYQTYGRGYPRLVAFSIGKVYFRSFSYPYFELNFLRNQIYVGIDDLWTLKALVWTPLGLELRQLEGVPSRRGYPRLAFSIGNVYFRSFSYPYFELNFLRNQIYVGIDDLWTLKALVWTTNPTGSRTPSTRGGTQPKRVPAPCLFYRKCVFSVIFVPLFRVKLSEKPDLCRYRRPMDLESTCMDYKPHWVSNSVNSRGYPAEEGTRALPFI